MKLSEQLRRWLSGIPASVGFFVLGTLVGVLVTWQFALGHFNTLFSQIRPIRDPDVKYPLINPLLTYDLPSGQAFQFDSKLQMKLTDLIGRDRANGMASTASVYYRNLPQGHWVGVNENIPYDPASLLKIALVIAYYKEAEVHPGILNTSVTYTEALDAELTTIPYQTASNLIIGEKYTVNQLIDDLMVNSDNGAKNALLSQLDDHALDGVYFDLGIQNPDLAPNNYQISAKDYSLFFRILYNATYLNREMSERLLDLLVHARYNNGIVAGTPAGVKVAQKYGEHVTTDANNRPIEFQLHDCGIVYRPGNPYLLCIMTRGTNVENLTGVIQEIARTVYAYTQNQ